MPSSAGVYLPSRRGGLTRRDLLGFRFPTGHAAPDDRGHWIRLHRAAMACRFEITLDGRDARQPDEIEDARACIRGNEAIDKKTRLTV